MKLSLLSSTDLGSLAADASAYLNASKSPATRRAYASDWAQFTAWCTSAGLSSLPAEPTTVGLYLAHMANNSSAVSSIERALAAIVNYQRDGGHYWPKGHPAVTQVMQGIKRTHGTKQAQKAPVMDTDLARMVGTLGVDLGGLRDRALLTVGWFGAFRRSELVALQVSDVRFVNEGVIITVAKGKTDQEGRGFEKGLPYAGSPAVCPVRSLRSWLEASSISSGPIFRAVCHRTEVISSTAMHDKLVAKIVQRAAKAAGVTTDVSGHSLRSGFATSAAAKGKSLEQVMKQGGWKSDRIARGYIRHASLFTQNAASGLL